MLDEICVILFAWTTVVNILSDRTLFVNGP